MTKTEWYWFAAKAVVGLLLLQMAISAFHARYRVGFDTQDGNRSTPYRMFLIDLRDRQVIAGEMFAFQADERHQPWFPTGTMMVKYVEAVPGETVNFDGASVTNPHGRVYPHSKAILAKIRLRRPTYPLVAPGAVQVPEHEVLMLNPMSESFDGRYWGFVSLDRIVGRAIPLF